MHVIKYYFDVISPYTAFSWQVMRRYSQIWRDQKVEIEMMSRRFFFLIKQPYGIDTLSSNGCLKELKKNSFEKMIRSMGFISLNQTNNGINIKSILSRNILHKILSIFIRLKLKNS